jgi:hypothetical protein
MAPPSHVSQLVVAPRRQILGDTRRNLSVIAVILAIALLYVVASAALVAWAETWSYGEGLYFTVINVTTVGFGDYAPKTPIGRVIASVNAIIGLLMFGILVAVVSLAFQPGEYTATATIETSSGSEENIRADRVREPTATVQEAVSGLLAAIDFAVRHGKGHPEAWRGKQGHIEIHLDNRDGCLILHIGIDAG